MIFNGYTAPARLRAWARGLALASATLLLAGCTTGYGGYGTGYPDRGTYPGQYGGQTLSGTVQQVDTYRDRIILSGGSGYGRGSRVELHYDRSTRLYYQGQQLAVEGLEPGDGIRVQAVRAGNGWRALSIEVVRNVRDSYGRNPYDPYGNDRYDDDRYGDDRYGNDLRGTVVFVDPRARVIELESGYGRHGNRTRVRYDHRTVVEYRGRRYRPENLERGDIVRIEARRWGNGWFAERIRVERDVSWRR